MSVVIGNCHYKYGEKGAYGKPLFTNKWQRDYKENCLNIWPLSIESTNMHMAITDMGTRVAIVNESSHTI